MSLRASVLALAIVVIATAPAGAVCIGDCNGDGVVRINELIVGVRMALGDPQATCEAFTCGPVVNCLTCAVRNGVSCLYDSDKPCLDCDVSTRCNR